MNLDLCFLASLAYSHHWLDSKTCWSVLCNFTVQVNPLKGLFKWRFWFSKSGVKLAIWYGISNNSLGDSNSAGLQITFEQEVSRKGVCILFTLTVLERHTKYYCPHLVGPSTHEAVEVERWPWHSPRFQAPIVWGRNFQSKHYWCFGLTILCGGGLSYEL